MSTINEFLVGEIIRGNGHYKGDTQAVKIVSYSNIFNGDTAYAVVYSYDDYNKYENSPACSNVKVLWELKKGGPK